MRRPKDLGVYSSSATTLVLLRWGLLPGPANFRRLTDHSPRDMTVSAFPVLGPQAGTTMPCFAHGFWAPNPGPHACEAAPFLTEESAQPSFLTGKTGMFP